MEPLTKPEVESLIHQHSAYVLNLLRRYLRTSELAEDILQEASLKAFIGAPKFRRDSSFKSWFAAIAINTAKNHLRQKRNMAHEELSPSYRGDPPTQTPEELLQTKDFLCAIMDEVLKLPAKQQRAFILRVYDGLDYRAVAEILNCCYDTAKANVRHATLKLRNFLEAQN